MATEKKIVPIAEGNKPVVPFEALTQSVAGQFNIEPLAMWKAIKAECFPSGAASDEQMFMFLQAVDRYKLNPFMKEIYAAVSPKTGKLIIGVQTDGWGTLAHRHPHYKGFQFEYEKDASGKVNVVTCKVYRDDWEHPGEFRAEMNEWKIDKDTWKQRPVHQLCIKAFNNAVRFTLGLTGIQDQDDIDRIQAEESKAKQKTIETTAQPAAGEENKDGDSSSISVDSNNGPSVDGGEPATSPEAGGARPPGTARPVEPVAQSPDADNRRMRPSIQEPATGIPVTPPSEVRVELDKFIARSVTAARLGLLLGQMGVAKVEELSDEQAATLLRRLQKRGK